MENIFVKDNELTEHTIVVESLSHVSDGYHTIQELYDHRISLYIALCISQVVLGTSICYYKIDPSCEGWFILYLESRSGVGQVSYHLPNKYLPIIERFAIKDDFHIWDGHSSADVVKRLDKLISQSADAVIVQY